MGEYNETPMLGGVKLDRNMMDREMHLGLRWCNM